MKEMQVKNKDGSVQTFKVVSIREKVKAEQEAASKPTPAPTK